MHAITVPDARVRQVAPVTPWYTWLMHDAIVSVPDPVNEPVLSYAPNTPERARLKAALAAIEKEVVEIPCVVGGQRVHTGKIREVVMPHRHKHVVARFHAAEPDTAERAIRAALEAKKEWSAMRWESRAAVLLRAAELLAGPWRARMNAATMHGQSKTAHQAEIDSACELIDFLRFNVAYAERIYREQPESSSGVWNRLDRRVPRVLAPHRRQHRSLQDLPAPRR